ncbi:IgGFc-binding protein-like [Amphiura filiformis]|uniref:IgGFc-binding protein-like n=1 Tax=Amphiura filiformis TaxID=82378 RepID=UPI003B228EB2
MCVGKVVIFNRDDCCDGRLSGAQVRVGSDSNAKNNPKFGTVNGDMINQARNRQSNMLEVSRDQGGRLGKYISIHLPGQEYLQFCEIKAYIGTCEEEINLIGKPTKQSSTYDNIKSPSGNAVDGNTDGNYYSRSCMHTQENDKAWWSVDMGDNYCVGNVEIFNRVDCCEKRLVGAVVRVGDDSGMMTNPVCGTITGESGELGEIILSCNRKGRYLSIHLPSKGFLHICEVKVYPGKCGLGPFASCFDVIDPATYFSNCKYDICSGSPVEAVCDDLAQYASDCNARGVELLDNWRDMVPSCASECALHEIYIHCGPACQPTCSDPEPYCVEQCIEGCFCKENLLWTPDGCVSADQCGCTYNGEKYYAPNAKFLKDDCSEECTCQEGGEILCAPYGDGSCDENAQCTINDKNGKRDCYCRHGFVQDGHKCAAWHECRAFGEPHYNTFDDRKYDFMGQCEYTLVKTISGDISFEVIVKNIAFKYDPIYSLTKQVTIKVDDLEITIGPKKRIRVNGEKITLPFDSDGIYGLVRVYREDSSTILETDFGLEVIWDGVMAVTVRLLDTFMNNAEGLCGYFNGDELDDFKGPLQTLIHNVNEFGNSWKYDGREGCDCVLDDPDSCPDVDPCDAKVDVSDLCFPVSDINGPFALCRDAVDPQPYFKDCSFDSCAAQNSTDILCDYFTKYVYACREVGVAINGWRNEFHQCAIDCGPTKRYTDCANPCQATCLDPNAENNPTCAQRACFQGCECLSGLVLSGDECVLPSQCGCTQGGRYYSAGTRFVASDCSSTCRCIGKDLVECDDLGCGDNAVCDVQDDVRGCYCEEGYELLSDGKTCKDTSPCSPNPCLHGGQCVETADSTSFVCQCPFGVWGGPLCNERYYKCFAAGDPHYRSFDGRRFDFQGRCKYTLVKSLPGAPHDFEVVVNNEQFRKKPVAVTKDVYVYFTHNEISYELRFTYGPTSTFYLDELKVNVPFYLKNDDGTVHISVERIGPNIVLKSEFGLIVVYNGRYTVWIHLSEDYMKFVGGLCGSFDGDSSNDFTDPEFNLANNPNDFGNSWVSGECATVCTPTTCPVDPCEGNIQGMMAGVNLCEPLENELSVFKECFAVVDPTQFLKDCKFDVCQRPDDKDLLCEIFNLYATACEEADVSICNWRASIPQCQIECGQNMEYQTCGTPCPATCTEPEPQICVALACVDGCQCMKGFVLDNDRCVPKDQCGCKRNGMYYKRGETFLSDDCTSEFTCEPEGLTESPLGCSENEVCEIKNGERGCYCPVGFFNRFGVCQRIYTCRACGDPHYTTFDGRRYDYQGRCSYILAQTGANAPNAFLVVGDNLPWVNPRATVTRYVHIYAYELHVQFSYDTIDVLVDQEIVHLPYLFGNGKLKIYNAGRNKVLLTDFGLRVIWDGNYCLHIDVPANFVNHVDGLCGHLSQDKSDDLMNPDGIVETNINSFGDSWAHGEECQPCTPETCPQENPCDSDADAAQAASDACSPLSGPIAECLKKVDASELLYDCKYDICTDPGNKDVACMYLEKIATLCRENRIDVNRWRDDVPFCAIECPQFMKYADCGSGCPNTCANPSASTEYCTLGCVEGCVCQPGLLLSEGACVVPEECGCTRNGKYYLNEEIFVEEACDRNCTCKEGKIECIHHSCGENAICEIQNGVRKCYCLRDYIGDGQTCTKPCEQSPNPCQTGAQCVNDVNADGGYYCQCREGFTGPKCEISLLICRASGDPHYLNFDAKKFNFQGDCEYVLTQNCSSDIPEFKVIVDNQKSSRNNKVALTRSVTVLVHGQTIVLTQKRDVQVNNGGKAVLPFYDPNYSIFLSGSSVILTTDFNLVVEWSGRSTVIVKVPSGYRGHLCGLCGNGNGGGRTTPTGELKNNINVWGHSWATNQGQCEECTDCPTDEDMCETVDPAIKEDANKMCAIINAVEGEYHPVPEDIANAGLAKRSVVTKRKRIVRRSVVELSEEPTDGGQSAIARDRTDVKLRRKRSYFDQYCCMALGLEDGRIGNEEITASSIYDSSYSAAQGRLNNKNKYWATQEEVPNNAFIQIRFRKEVTLCGIRTQGSAQSAYNEYVTALEIQCGETEKEDSLRYILDDQGNPKEFAANYDRSSAVDITLPKQIDCRILRIIPKKWNEWVALRFEVIGCYKDFNVNCMAPLGMESGMFSDGQIEASDAYEKEYNFVAKEARLRNDLYWSTADENPTHPWIQVYFQQKVKVYGLRTQGSSLCNEFDEWVTSLSIQYGDNKNSLTYITDADGNPKVFRANFDCDSVVTIIFEELIDTKILRIVPVQWHYWIALRFEVLGCPIHHAIPLQGKTTAQSSTYDINRSPPVTRLMVIQMASIVTGRVHIHNPVENLGGMSTWENPNAWERLSSTIGLIVVGIV